MNIFALTTYGLEAVSAAEIAALPGVRVTGTAYRRITAAADDATALLRLRTVDDAYYDAGTWEGIRHTRDMLAALQWYAAQMELDAAADAIGAWRDVPANPLFSVTASFVGKRNYNSDEIKATVAQAVRGEWGWRYTADDREADLNIRIFIEQETAYAGVRLSRRPLHERAYRVVERPGALKASVAAALVQIAGVQAGQTLIDPCAGTGVIPIEAVISGAAARGGDHDADAVAAARTNADAAGMAVPFEQWDARALPLASASTDYVITNLPWGRQVTVDDELGDLYAGICREVERVIAASGRVVMLTSLPHLLRFDALTAVDAVAISLFGQRPTIGIYQKA